MNRSQVNLLRDIKILEKRIKQVIPEIYACFAKALYKEGYTSDEIEALFVETQNLWQENVEQMEDMITWVRETTGIDVRGEDYI